jgi:hypothetical protein
MHDKERVIAPLLKEALDMHVTVPHGFNSDLFGTFTRDIARTGNQLETARAKALAAMELTGCDLGIASEGSFGADPQLPFIQSNLELVLLVDRKNNIEIRGHHRSATTCAVGAYVSTFEEALTKAHSWGFPDHGVILRAHEHLPLLVEKNITSEEELKKCFNTLQANPLLTSLYLETDMRAHRNPTRMENIRSATEDLIRNCLSCCPKCNTPGFVSTHALPGAVCRECERNTDRPKGSVYECFSCGYTEERLVEGVMVDPGECQYCNP